VSFWVLTIKIGRASLETLPFGVPSHLAAGTGDTSIMPAECFELVDGLFINSFGELRPDCPKQLSESVLLSILKNQ
jgi:hypothetical protein